MKIVADSHIPFVDEYFGAYGEIVKVLGRDMTAADVKDADLLMVRSVTPVNEKLLSGSSVKFVGSMTAGADHMDAAWLDQSGIQWSTAAGFNAPPVADYIVCMVAALMQRRELPQKRFKVVVVGVGHVGSLVVDRMKLLDHDVIMCDPFRARDEENFKSIELNKINDVDLILLHVPLTKEGEFPTYHFIDAEFIKRQKPGCAIINAGRGAVIDESALIAHGAHLSWCLDVFENEPNVDKVLLERATLTTPHIAGYSVQSKVRGIDAVYQAACKSGVIESQEVTPIEMPRQLLNYSGTQHRWQDIVLGVFNPVVMTAMMRSSILSAENHDVIFDELRNRFDYRHEFAYTTIPGLVMQDNDVRILARLGFDLSSKLVE